MARYAMTTRRAACLAAALALGATAQPAAGAAVTAPFVFSGRTWCPTYRSSPPGSAASDCDTIQTAGANRTVAFDPAMVSLDQRGRLVFHMKYKPYYVNGTEYPYRTGAANTHHYGSYGLGTYSARIKLPCTDALVDNWPAFWLYGDWTNNTNTEIDIMEGLGGKVRGGLWLYKRQSDGTISRSHYPASPALAGYCGWHTFAVYRGLYVLTFRYDGAVVGKITASQAEAFTGQATLPTAPLFARLDWDGDTPPYGYCCGGPFTPSAQMITAWVRTPS